MYDHYERGYGNEYDSRSGQGHTIRCTLSRGIEVGGKWEWEWETTRQVGGTWVLKKISRFIMSNSLLVRVYECTIVRVYLSGSLGLYEQGLAVRMPLRYIIRVCIQVLGRLS